MAFEEREFAWGDGWRARVAERFAADSDLILEWLSGFPEALRNAAQLTKSNDTALLRLEWSIGGELVPLVIKPFNPKGSLGARWDKVAGSPAMRSWNAALHLGRNSICTPQPFAVIEEATNGVPRRSWYISEELPAFKTLQEALVDLYHGNCDSILLIDLLQSIADNIRNMHASGLIHGDLGNQNIALLRDADGHIADVCFLDLSRAKFVPQPDLAVLAKDLCRIHLPSDLLRIFFEMYFGSEAPKDFLRFERRYRNSFKIHTRSRRWRHPIRERRRSMHRDNPVYPDDHDIWIWDTRSQQAVSAFTSKDRKKMISAGQGIQVVRSTVKFLPRIWRQYKQYCRAAFEEPVSMKNRVGCAVTPDPARWELESKFLTGLGVLPVLLRFYFHESKEQNDFIKKCVKELYDLGYSVSIALIQNRQAVRNPDRWSAFCREILRDTHSCIELAEIGHASNRVKWGCWTSSDYATLANVVPSMRSAYPGVKFTGPAGIDFEYQRVLGTLEAISNEVQFDALSHHLYVDRRGAPENEQAGFCTWKKCALAKAIAAVHPRVNDKLIISEVNWPLLDTGVYSPVGSPYLFPGQQVRGPSVDEGTYARYMIRYFLQTICSGMVDRVYWWNLAAHGFGLIDDKNPSDWRPRAGYSALKTWLGLMDKAVFTGRQQLDNGEQKYSFKYDQGELQVRYTFPEETEGRITSGVSDKVLDIGGKSLTGRGGIYLTGDPIYCFEE